MDVGLTVGDSLDRLEATLSGFDFAELSIGEGTASSDAAESRVGIDEQRLRALLRDADADLCVHLPYKQEVATSVPEINDAIVDYQERLLAWAGSAGADKAVLHGTVRNPHDVDLRPAFADQLERITAAGHEAGVEVVVENVGHQKLGLPLTVLGDLARESGTSICFDVGHAYMEDGDDGVERFAKRYGDLVTHLHVHDVRRRGDTHIPIGAGEVDYAVVAEHLGGFDGTVAVEVFTDDVALLRDSARRATDSLEDG